MAFADTQIRKLRSKLKPAHIKTREADGNTLHYVEGWHVVAEANRIFGFDGWDRESVTSTCVWTKQTGLRFAAAYVTRVRITVRAGRNALCARAAGQGNPMPPLRVRPMNLPPRRPRPMPPSGRCQLSAIPSVCHSMRGQDQNGRKSATD